MLIDLPEVNTAPVTAAILTGLLKPLLNSVNMVSAPAIARDRDISVSETKRARIADYHTLIRLTVTTEQRRRSVAGSLFGGDKPRLVEVEEIRLEAELTGHMIYVRNQDKPGLIGALGQALGAAGINIASFHLGRHEAGGDALALVAVDTEVPGKLMKTVCAMPSVLACKTLKF